ncbi:MAG: TolC family protein [Candidatus Omnitrophota bacterium]
MRILRVFLIIPIMLIVIEAAHPALPEGQSLNVLIEEAIENNPGVQAAYEKWKAAVYKITQASAFPDPMAKYGYFFDTPETRVGPQEQKAGISQKVPFIPKLGLKATAQLKNAKIHKEKYEAVKREIIKNTKLVYYDIYWVDKAIQITEEEKSVLENLEKVAQRKYESNLAPQQDVIKAQVELTELINTLFILRQNRQSLEARMNSILNRPRDSVIETATDIQPVKFDYGLVSLREMARESRQELLAANFGVEKAKYEKSIATFDYIPDITLGVDYVQVQEGYTRQREDGKDAWMGMIQVNVPIWFDRLGAKLNEKKAALQSSKKNYEDIKNIVDYEVEDLHYKIASYWDIYLLYKTALVPQAEQSFDAARTGYETGRVDFLNWLDSERMLLRTRLAYYRAIVDYLKSVAHLERIVGRDL